MVKHSLPLILVSIFLTSCISISRNARGVTIPQQNFVTATLVPTATKWVLVTPTVPPLSDTPSPVITAAPNCTTAAILLRDVTIQDDTHVNAGEKFTKTWEFQNTGTCPWVDTTIRFSEGDQLSAQLSARVADTPPSGKVQVSVELTAPTADGRYASYFTLLDSNGGSIPIGTQKTFWVRFIVGTYAMIPAASGAYPTPSGNCSYGPNANYVSEILSLINTERANAGVQILAVNTQMASFAQSHADDMAFNNFLSHDGSDGSFGERMAGYSMSFGEQIGGEILAIGTPQNAMEQWRRDEHWDYVLRPHYTQIGVGYTYNSCSDFGGYFTVDFR